MLRLGRLELSGGALVTLALFFYLDDQGLFPLSLTACAVHEGGHLLALKLLGGAVDRVRVTLTGAEIRLRGMCRLSYPREAMSVLAGPGANLLLAAACAGPMPALAGGSLILGLFNLLPIWPLDGGRLVYFLLASPLGEERAQTVCRRLAAVCVALAGAAGAVLLWRSGYNFTRLAAALWLAAAVRGRRKGLPTGGRTVTMGHND